MSEKNIINSKKRKPKTTQVVTKLVVSTTLEIRDLDALKTLPITCCDLLLLDNFSMNQLDSAINWLKEAHYNGQLEVSGNITLEKLSLYQDKAIHRISVGALTHSVKSLDLSLLID